MNTRRLSFWKRSSVSDIQLKKCLAEIGIEINLDTGHLYYLPNFKPVVINFDLVFIRHGETYGNCGQSIDGKIDMNAVKNNIKNKDKRIFQGNVDDEINQLTAVGKEQACEVANRLSEDFLAKGWEPDIILVSPLKRAQDTALPFIERHQFEKRVIVDEHIIEMCFGAWENYRICDFFPNDHCHSLYEKQDALVKSNAPNSENFCEVLLRAYQTLLDFNVTYADKRILMFSHSMYGAALKILSHLGEKIENGEYLAFDGTRKDGTSYTMPHTVPFVLHLRSPGCTNRSNYLRQSKL